MATTDGLVYNYTDLHVGGMGSNLFFPKASLYGSAFCLITKIFPNYLYNTKNEGPALSTGLASADLIDCTYRTGAPITLSPIGTELH